MSQRGSPELLCESCRNMGKRTICMAEIKLAYKLIFVIEALKSVPTLRQPLLIGQRCPDFPTIFWLAHTPSRLYQLSLGLVLLDTAIIF
jgi:hypothetical protein